MFFFPPNSIQKSSLAWRTLYQKLSLTFNVSARVISSDISVRQMLHYDAILFTFAARNNVTLKISHHNFASFLFSVGSRITKRQKTFKRTPRYTESRRRRMFYGEKPGWQPRNGRERKSITSKCIVCALMWRAPLLLGLRLQSPRTTLRSYVDGFGISPYL